MIGILIKFNQVVRWRSRICRLSYNVALYISLMKIHHKCIVMDWSCDRQLMRMIFSIVYFILSYLFSDKIMEIEMRLNQKFCRSKIVIVYEFWNFPKIYCPPFYIKAIIKINFPMSPQCTYTHTYTKKSEVQRSHSLEISLSYHIFFLFFLWVAYMRTFFFFHCVIPIIYTHLFRLGCWAAVEIESASIQTNVHPYLHVYVLYVCSPCRHLVARWWCFCFAK